jgi:hypothetical protein
VPTTVLDTANAEVDRLFEADPPPEGHFGFHTYDPEPVPPHPLTAPLLETPAITLAEELTAPHRLVPWDLVQVATNIPPNSWTPGGPHVDGIQPKGTAVPNTFSLLAGVFLTDQSARDSGNLWIWPGSHLTAGRWFAEHQDGADSFQGLADIDRTYPPVELGEPVQATGPTGSLLLAHHLLGHNIGNNDAPDVRRCLYYRLATTRHRETWRTHVTDPLADFAPTRRTEGSSI